MEIAAVQRRTLRLLFVTQIVSGVGVAIGASVGALLAAEIAGIGMSGLAQSANVVGAARYRSSPLLFAGYFLAGGATAAGFQARYAAVDLAPAALRGRHLSLIVWATTIGAVIGPSLAAPAGALLAGYAVPTLAAPFVVSALLFGLATLFLMLLLRPDPARSATW